MSSSMPTFAVPPDGEVFTNDILERAGALIDAGIWEGIDHVRLRTWLRNFDSPEEKYFAACVLDGLVYRSVGQTVAMMEQMLERTLVDHTRGSPPPKDVPGDWLAALRTRRGMGDPKIRIVPVIRDKDPPTKSGPQLARMYRRYLGLEDAWMIWPWQIQDQIKKGAKAFIFIDDFLGTGTQFARFGKKFDFANVLQGVYAVYAPLVAHREGLQCLAKELPYVGVCVVEALGARHSAFSPESPYFNDGTNSAASTKQFYEGLLERKLGSVPPNYREGWGKLQLTYVFQHAVPNNCLPILWWDQPGSWTPLFGR